MIWTGSPLGVEAVAAIVLWEARTSRAVVGACLAALVGMPAPNEDGRSALALIGLPASVSCMEIADGKGGVDIRFEGERIPLPGSENGTTNRISGVLHTDDTISATIVDVDAGGSLGIESAPEIEARPLAVACRQAVRSVSGVGG
jgi:hypothetical protein